jgi:amidase
LNGQLAFLRADGAHDIHKQLNLSGEPLIPELEGAFQLRNPINPLEYQDLTLQGRDYSTAYSDYWNATADGEDGRLSILRNSIWPPLNLRPSEGQIVDAVVMPVAPHAAVIPGKYYHTGSPTPVLFIPSPRP